MTTDDALALLARKAGVHDAFTDMNSTVRQIGPDTQRALLWANGIPADNDAAVRDSLAFLAAEKSSRILPQDLILTAGKAVEFGVARATIWALHSEDETQLIADGRGERDIHLPALDVGIYVLTLTTQNLSQTVTVLAKPPQAPSVAHVGGQEKLWGIVAALYGLRSDRNGGLGDYRDLADLARITGQHGASFLGINPVHALGWGDTQSISPYSPTHRGFLNTSHIALDQVLPQGAPQFPPAQSQLLDYKSHQSHHRPGLERAYAQFDRHAGANEKRDFETYIADGAEALARFSAFEVLSVAHGPDCRTWPQAVHESANRNDAVPAQARRFHMWMQWVADRQLGAAQSGACDNGMALGLYLDVAVGARLGGAEYWGAAEARAEGVSIGAPPDDLSPAGQNWGLCAYAPRKLTQTRYRALRQVFRQNMRHAGVVRIDHALGLNRSFWLPLDGTPGGYISQPFEALLAVLAIEAHKAGCVVVGEDLGLVPDGFRDKLSDAGIYGYTVMQFEREKDGALRSTCDLRPKTLACFGTHDTPTLHGFWQGRDIDWWRKLDWIAEDGIDAVQKTRDAEKRDLLQSEKMKEDGQQPFDVVYEKIHDTLASSPCALVAVQLDDVLGVVEAQNLPGTIDEHPNWRRPYHTQVEQMKTHPVLEKTAKLMRDTGRTRQGNPPERSPA
ncbi:MAG: 4-alpha-glucanotransferase [Roseobacter sp.]